MAPMWGGEHVTSPRITGYDPPPYCIRIRTRGGIYGEIWPEPKRGGLRPYFAVYPELSPNTDIISHHGFLAARTKP